MAVNLLEPEVLTPIEGIRCASIAAGIKASGAEDMVLFEIAPGSSVSAVFTRNAFCAAPVHIAKQHLQKNTPAYLLINSGNANAGTGQQGMDDALQSCQLVAQQACCDASQVLPFSTGVIGENLPMEKFSSAIPELYKKLDKKNWLAAAHGILTTDTKIKAISKSLQIEGRSINITGIAKGSGMIRPNMATMLAYIATDANVPQALLDRCLQDAVKVSFNAITVDGDTSTNDACVLMASGQSGLAVMEDNTVAYRQFSQAITEVLQFLAQAIIRDGEGATKFVEVHVSHAQTEAEARQVAYTLAHSPLVKTALFASDPNWGRILAAVGRSGVAMDIDAIEIYLDDVCIVKDGGRAQSYTEEQGQAAISKDEITIHINLKNGSESAQVWTCDLSYDYVKINAEYRS